MPDEDDEQAMVRSFELFVKDIAPTTEDIAKAGVYLVNKRRSQTLAGIDVEGDTFAPYSPATKKQGKAVVNLFGDKSETHMLDALTYRTPGASSLEVGVFGNAAIAERARVLNEGGQFRTRAGTGPEGFRNHPGRRQPRGKKLFATIPARYWLGASQEDLTAMSKIVVESALKRAEKK